MRILSALRSFGSDIIQQIMLNISRFIKIEADPFYQKGEEKGIEKGIEKGRQEERIAKDRQFVYSLLTDRNHSFSVEEIANLVGVSVEFVESVKQSLNK